jgi:hypothetical protein
VLTLTGNNSYTSITLLKKGTMPVAVRATLGSTGNTATITVENGVTFASTSRVNNNVEILSGGVLASRNTMQMNRVLGVTGKLNETTLISLRASGEWGENSYDAYGGHILLNHRW